MIAAAKMMAGLDSQAATASGRTQQGCSGVAAKMCIRDSVNGALTGKKDPDELQVLEYAYYEKCKDYLENSQSADAETWAAYESRIRACALLDNKDLEAVSYTHLDVYKRQG